MTIGRSYCIVIQVLRKHDAAVAQSVERRIGSAEVTDEMSKYCISWIGGEDKKWVKYEENKSGSPDL